MSAEHCKNDNSPSSEAACLCNIGIYMFLTSSLSLSSNFAWGRTQQSAVVGCRVSQPLVVRLIHKCFMFFLFLSDGFT